MNTSGPAQPSQTAGARAPAAPPRLAEAPLSAIPERLIPPPARGLDSRIRAARVLICFPFYNEIDKLRSLGPKVVACGCGRVVAIDDGSTDGGPEYLRTLGVEVLTQAQRSGVGAAIKRAVRYGIDNDYEILVVMAGNNKDDPAEIPRLLKPILEDDCHYVQGSRFLAGGSSPNLPFFRWWAIQLLSFLFRLRFWKSCTDLTNGFRAYRLSLLRDPRIDIWQSWLDTYEYEYYVHWYAYRLGYKVAEVPVTKAYPAQKGVSYSKIRPFSDWWRMLRPFVLLALGLKK